MVAAMKTLKVDDALRAGTMMGQVADEGWMAQADE